MKAVTRRFWVAPMMGSESWRQKALWFRSKGQGHFRTVVLLVAPLTSPEVLGCQDTAVDWNDSAGDEARSFGGEKDGKICNIGRPGQAPQRNPR